MLDDVGNSWASDSNLNCFGFSSIRALWILVFCLKIIRLKKSNLLKMCNSTSESNLQFYSFRYYQSYLFLIFFKFKLSNFHQHLKADYFLFCMGRTILHPVRIHLPARIPTSNLTNGFSLKPSKSCSS